MMAAADDVSDRLASKLPLIRRVASAFVWRSGWIEYDDAVQIVSLEALLILRRSGPGEMVDHRIAQRGWQRLVDEVRAHGPVTRKRIRRGTVGAVSLSKVITTVEEPSPLELISTLPADGDSYADSDLAHDVAHAMATLPERLRFVVWMYYFEDFCMEEIADLLGVSHSRVSQLLKLARARLRPLV